MNFLCVTCRYFYIKWFYPSCFYFKQRYYKRKEQTSEKKKDKLVVFKDDSTKILREKILTYYVESVSGQNFFLFLTARDRERYSLFRFHFLLVLSMIHGCKMIYISEWEHRMPPCHTSIYETGMNSLLDMYTRTHDKKKKKRWKRAKIKSEDAQKLTLSRVKKICFML